jgi:hypothetical protein
MEKPKAFIRVGFFSVLIFSIILCSFTTGLARQGAMGTPFQPVPTIDATIPTAVGVMTPIPTLAVGQYFERGDQDIPQIATMIGDDDFGYGRIVGSSNLFLIWISDADGTYYLVIDEEDADTKGMWLDYKDFIDQRETKIQKIEQIERDIEGVVQSAKLWEAGIVIIVGVGTILCVTSGIGCIATFIALGVTSMIEVADLYGDEEKLQKDLIASLEDLYDLESNLTGTYVNLQFTMRNP